MPLPENIIILFYWTAPEGGLFRYSVIQEYYYLEKEGTIT